VILLGACTRDEKRSSSNATDSLTTDTLKQEGELDSLPWNTTYNETTQRLQLDHKAGSMAGVGHDEIINLLNKKYPGIKMKYVGMQGDTIITRIDDAMHLTQSIGTSGAESYLAEATFSLTEIPSIKAVKIDFEEGDHAMPGTFTRASFKDFN
jgi:hypothetical protein